MKWNELRKLAEQQGWFLIRHGANHDIYGHPDIKERIVIGRHGKEEVPKGTYNSIKKLIGF